MIFRRFESVDTKTGYNNWSVNYDNEKNVLIELDKLNGFKRLQAIENHVVSRKMALDLCCGTGRHISLLEKYFDITTGIDFSYGMLEKAYNKIKKYSTKIICNDVLMCHFGHTKFDFINFSLALIHFSNLTEIISYIRSILNNNGLLFIADAERDFLLTGSMSQYHLKKKDANQLPNKKFFSGH